MKMMRKLLCSPENKMLNWARDFIQQQQRINTFCDEFKFNDTFLGFKEAYKYKGSLKDVKKMLKEEKYIKIKNGKIFWLMPLDKFINTL